MYLNGFNWNKQRTTHMGVLVKVFQLSEGPILELGAGPVSTPLLHWLCAETGRTLITIDNHPTFYGYAKRFKSRNHTAVYTEDWSELDKYKYKWGMVFIDHSGKPRDDNRRGGDAIRLKDKADYIVLHDTDNEDTCGYVEMWPHFKYRWDWKYCRPRTSVVSNRKDVTKWN